MANSDENYCCFLATCSGSNIELQVSCECDAIFEWLVSALPSAGLHSPRVVPSLSRLMFCVFYEYSAKNTWDLDFQAVLQSTALQKHLLQSLLINPNPKKRSISPKPPTGTTGKLSQDLPATYLSHEFWGQFLWATALYMCWMHKVNHRKTIGTVRGKNRTLQKWSLPFVGVKCHQKFKQSPFFWW